MTIWIKLSLAVLIALCFKTSSACDSTLVIRFANGNKSIVKKYKEGLPCGRWTYYSIQKKVLKKEKYKNGLLVFTWIYNDKNQVVETINKKGKHKKFVPCNCK